MGASIEVVEPRLLPGVVADEIIHSVADAVDEKGRCSLVLSGGGSPGAIYRLLSHPPRVSEAKWDKIQIYWGDERWVAKDDSQSNYRMTHETLLAHIKDPKPMFSSVDVSVDTPEEAAQKYAETIRKNEGLGQDELPSFDLVLLGLGSDGHIASIFPESPVIKNSKELCSAVRTPDGKGHRITIGLDALFSAKQVIFIVRGERKADIVKKVLEGDDPFEKIPARYYLNAKGSVMWFLDSAAAKKLTNVPR